MLIGARKLSNCFYCGRALSSSVTLTSTNLQNVLSRRLFLGATFRQSSPSWHGTTSSEADRISSPADKTSPSWHCTRSSEADRINPTADKTISYISAGRIFDQVVRNQETFRQSLPLDKREFCTTVLVRDKSEVSQGVKSNKKDNILTIPNLLCVSRIVAAPVLANLIIEGKFEAAALLFVAAGFTDLLDGWIARNFKGQSSSLGSFLDPLADKILVCTVYLSLTFANLIPPSLCSLIVSRDLFLVYAGLYIRYMSVIPPFSLKKYFDVSLPTATVQPTTISKINTGLQFLLIAVSIGAPILSYTGHPYLHYLWAATGTTTLLSAVSYAFMKDTYKFSHREYDHQFGKKLTAFLLFILFNVAFTLKFPTQKVSGPTPGEDKECPLTGIKGAECPIEDNQDEKDFYSERSNQYYLKKIRNKDLK